MVNSEYYSQVFHEIKNSVTLINSYMQLIEKKHSEITAFDYWSTSRKETARLCSITTELSQVKLGSQLVLDCIDLRDFLSGCCSGFRCSAGEDEISCTLSMPAQPLMVSIDSRQLRHAIVNLLKNSCEAMKYHGRILVDAFQESGDAVIHITDFGCGISDSMIRHIFDPFTTTKEDGSGLGLNIARQVIIAHNGTIAVASREGDGCTFTVTLPLAPSAT